MWIYEKFKEWTDNKGDPRGYICDHMFGRYHSLLADDDRASSARLYYESSGKDFVECRSSCQ